MPSAPKLLSSWKICLVATPLAFQTSQVSTVVAAHWMSPEAMARWRLCCGIFLIVASTPFFLKMPACAASVIGANPVQPLMPILTLSCAAAEWAATAQMVPTRMRFIFAPWVLCKDLTPMNSRVIRAPRGTQLSAKSWLTEAPLRMLMNNLDPEVAERPDDLVVYGGIGRAARNWDCYDRIVRALRTLGDDETLLVQSGKPVGVFRTHTDAPRVLIANSNLVGR